MKLERLWRETLHQATTQTKSSDCQVSTTPVSCLALFEQPLDKYFADCIKASEASTKIFFHIPKTGGSSIRSALEEELPYFLNIKQYSELDLWDDIVKENLVKPYDMISGHLRFRSLRTIYESRANIVPITFIREPVSRIISQYRYMVSPKYPRNMEFIKKFPTIEHFVNEGISDNPMVKVLVGNCNTVEQALKIAEKNYMFVGLTEFSAMHSFIVQRCFGLNRFNIPGRINRTIKIADNEIEISDRINDMIQKRSRLDIDFYQFFKARHLSIADDVFSAFYAAVAGGETYIPFRQ